MFLTRNEDLKAMPYRYYYYYRCYRVRCCCCSGGGSDYSYINV